MNNDLRWRKWPEEKPEEGSECVAIDQVGRGAVATFRLDLESEPEGAFECDGWCITITHWMPLSALPEIEDTNE